MTRSISLIITSTDRYCNGTNKLASASLPYIQLARHPLTADLLDAELGVSIHAPTWGATIQV